MNAPAGRFDWSIGIYAGASPLTLAPHPEVACPVLCRTDISDVDARLVADPFMVCHDGRWYLFVEILDGPTGQGVIGLATSDDAVRWTYEGVVLREGFHLSYPLVFGHRGEFFMVPETLKNEAVTLYHATAFPRGWQRVASLVPGSHADPTVFEHEGRWWMFTCPTPYAQSELALYTADSLTGPWRPHPASPLRTGDRRYSRPAGRVIAYQGGLLRFAQDCSEIYGRSVHAFALERLDAHGYGERRCSAGPLLTASGRGWNAERMHHVDAHARPDGQWIACVDGSDV